MATPVNNNKPRKYRVLFREEAKTAVAEGFLDEWMTRSCRIFSIFSPAVIFSLRSKAKFAKSVIKDCERECDARVS